MRDGITDEDAVRQLSKLSDERLSRMIDIVRAQIPIAADARQHEAVSCLQHHERVIAAARMMKNGEVS
jgi:hypothetical protein